MNQHETSWFRKLYFLTMLLLISASSATIVKPASAQTTPANFEKVDAYRTTKMKELGIPNAALVIVRDD